MLSRGRRSYTRIFDSPITESDQQIFGASTGTCEGQQVWEALAVLCALRLWSDRWRHKRIRLRVKTDNVAALVMAVRMKAKGRGTSIVARELALDIAEAVYGPTVCAHVPGGVQHARRLLIVTQ